jgi:dTDP-4-amino-4,6-dideoxygalactose transaminase
MSGNELKFIKKAFDSNYIAPAGPQVREFESKFAAATGFRYCAAVVPARRRYTWLCAITVA